MTKLKSCFFGVSQSGRKWLFFSNSIYMCIRSRESCFCCFFYLKFSRVYSKCVLEVEEAVSVVSFISSSPGYIVNESNEQSLDYWWTEHHQYTFCTYVPECEIIKALASVLFVVFAMFLYQLCLIELRNPNSKVQLQYKYRYTLKKTQAWS